MTNFEKKMLASFFILLTLVIILWSVMVKNIRDSGALDNGLKGVVNQIWNGKTNKEPKYKP